MAPRDDRPIATIDRMRGELFCQADVRAVVLGGDDQPRRILVDPVDDARPRDSADPAQLPRAMVEQRVDQRAVEITRGRSEEHTSELQSLMRISYAVFCLKKKKQHNTSKNQS